ncbi:MAG TPA: carboxynorspermidine decarboxylase [Candidatus Paceibacterota bacterium]|nr:carboxynorspermidine decarboxylase [Candidatus Paceibacterota bacterium]
MFIEPWVDEEGWNAQDFSDVETPCYVVSEERLEHNLKILSSVQEKTGCKIIMALKSFSMFSVFPLIKKYLTGSEASSVNEARLGYKKFGGEVHVFSPSYTKENMKEYVRYADHMVFNSFSQWNKFKNVIKNSKKKISCGIRVNVEHSETENPMYDPSRPNSHFGVTKTNFESNNLDGIDGLHFHNLCELNADALERTLKVFEEKFGEFLPRMKWVNFGGGHHITRKDYDIALLNKIIMDFKAQYPHLQVYLEPGEAIALNAGILIGSVVDITKNNMNIAVIDVSATTHMPDVLEMPYLPTILGAKSATEGNVNIYRLVGPSCLTGDVIGDYSFPQPSTIGQKIIFLNMAIYTMVKNNTFNGINLPSIAIIKKPARPHDSSGAGGGKIKIIKKFGYKDFKERLS